MAKLRNTVKGQRTTTTLPKGKKKKNPIKTRTIEKESSNSEIPNISPINQFNQPQAIMAKNKSYLKSLKRVFKLIFVSYFFKKLLGLAFLIHGSYIAIKRWEFLRYLEDVAIINDVWLNVVGKYSIHQAISENPVFGSRLQTISAAMYLAKLHNFGIWCGIQVEKLDENHFEKAFNNHKEIIKKEYEFLFGKS